MTRNIGAFFWTVSDKIGIQLFSFVVGIFLARLLTPFDYGVVGLSTIFIALTDMLIESGFSNALIRKQDRSQIDLSTAFIFNISLSLFLYVLLFFLSPYIAVFFDTPILSPVLRIVSINVVINSLCVVQNAIFLAEFRLKILAIINFVSLLPSSFVALLLAFKGYGVYALVLQSVIGGVIRFLLLWYFAKWRPSLEFSKQSFAYLWGFGSKLILTRFIGICFNKVNTFIIGKYIGKTDLGYYSKAESLSSQPDSVISGVILKAAVPIFSECQDDKTELLARFRKYSRIFSLVLCYICGALFLIARPLIILLWTAKWDDTVILFRILLLASILSPLSALNLILLQVLNKTGVSLKLEIIKKMIYLPVIFVGALYGLLGLALSQIVISFVAFFVNSSASKKYISYAYLKQITDALAYIIPMIIAILLLFDIVNSWITSNFLSVIVGVMLYSILFFSFLYIIKDRVFVEYSKMAFGFINKMIKR